MELGLLNLMPGAGTVDDGGFAIPEGVDGAAFTALLAQLGLTPAAAETAPGADELAARLPGAQAAMLAPMPIAKVAADAATMPEADAAADSASGEAAIPLDLAALGLPPLMAALLAPSPQAAPTVPVTVGFAPSTATAVPTPSAPGAMPLAVTVDGGPPMPVPAAPPELAKAVVAERAVPVELAPLAALTRRPGDAPLTGPIIRPERASKGESAVAAAVETTSLSILRTPQAPIAPSAAPVETLAAAQPVAEPAVALEVPIQHQLDLARDGEWLDQLAKDIARTATGEGLLRFKLNPEHLGSLQVEVTQGAAGASVRLTADTEAARAVIADARPQLIAEARAQGVRIAEAHVDLGSGSQSHGGGAQRDGRDLPERTYLTSWQPESAEEDATPPRRSASERYA